MCCEVSLCGRHWRETGCFAKAANGELGPSAGKSTSYNALSPLRNAISAYLGVLIPSRSLIEFLAARDNWSINPHDRESGAINSHWGMGLEGTEDIMLGLRVFEEAGFDPFEGMSLEALEKERQKWTTCRNHFESELQTESH
jgi:hypothetical protein